MSGIADAVIDILSSTEFWSALVGAIVGGVIAFAVQIYSLKEGKRQREEDREQVRRALGHALLFKMIKIHSNIAHFHEHLEDPFKKIAERGETAEPWQVMLPLSNLPEAINFSSDEMGLLLSLKENALFNSILSMDAIHNSLVATFATFQGRRYALSERLAATDMEGNQASAFLSKEQFFELRPRMVEINDLVDSMRERACKDYLESGDVLDKLVELLNDRIKLGVKISRSGV